MYIFTADPAQLRFTESVSNQSCPFGRFHSISSEKGALIWAKDPFTSYTVTVNSVLIETRRPKIDDRGVTTFRWNFARGIVTLDRDWSGVFSLRFSRKLPLVVASHAKLVSLVLRKATSLRSMDAGSTVEVDLGRGRMRQLRKHPKLTNLAKTRDLSYSQTLRRVRDLVIDSVRLNTEQGTALLLSGGIDSTILAAVARYLGIRLRTFTFALANPPHLEHGISSDRICAEEAASRYGHVHRTILLRSKSLRANIPIAIYLAETARGTIVDELPAHIEMARIFKADGIRRVLTGEGADDLFGAFPFALRYYQGRELKEFLQRELLRGLPDELAILQDVYSPWDVSLVHPYWTRELRSLGYSLPLHYRVDSRRLMKRVLRDAFADLLPDHLRMRPKGVPRDCTQIRGVLEEVFGGGPARYRSILDKMMKRRSKWPDELLRTLQNK